MTPPIAMLRLLRAAALAALLTPLIAHALEIAAARDDVRLTARLLPDSGRLMDGDGVSLEIKLSDPATGAPLTGLRPAAWIDNRGVLAHPGGREASCRERVGTYVKGNVGSRPLVDLNGYFLLSLNRDPTISVIDPMVGIGGRTNLLTNIILPRPGADWSEHQSRRRLLVTLPRMDQVALIDTERLRMISTLNTGREPVRVVVQQNGPLAFTGNNGDATVTVIDLASGRSVDTIAVGQGHHELQLVEGKARLFVTNRTDDSVSIIDTAARRVIRTESLPGRPSALAYSAIAERVYLSAGTQGTIVALDSESGAPSAQVRLGHAIDAIYVTPDGRKIIALSTQAKLAYVLDTADLRILHQIAAPAAPYQLTFTSAFAHIRMYDTERVGLLSLADLNSVKAPLLGSYAAGTGGPRRETVAVMASGIAPSPDTGAVVVSNPADGRIHYYMEGMNAISGSFRNYGHVPQAVRVTERSLRETAPGTYAARMRLPASGTLSLALRIEQPRIVECLDFEVATNPSLQAAEQRLQLAFGATPPQAAASNPVTVRIRVLNEAGVPGTLPPGAMLKSFRAPGVDRAQTDLIAVADGLYQAKVRFNQKGAYYLQVDSAAKTSPAYLTVLIRE